MSVSRAFAALPMLAPLLAGVGCSSAGGSPCTYCDGGKTDVPSDIAEDFPASEAGPAAEAADEAVASPAEVGDGRPPTTRDTPPGETPQLTPIPDGGYRLVDDFQTSEAPGWEVLGEESPSGSLDDWSVILGTSGSVFSEGILDADNWHLAYATAAIGPDQIVEAKLRAVDFYAEAPSYVAALFARYDPTADSGYFVALRGDGSVIVRRRDHGISASWGSGVDAGIRAGVWYIVRLEVIGHALNAFIDGTPVASVIDDNPLASGGIALGTLGATMEVDRVSAAEP
jgi:hypothetical protein